MKTEKTHSEEQAELQLQNIIKLVDALDAARKKEDCEATDKIEREITESVLSVECRTGWFVPDAERHDPEEYKILLCWGGPACRIIGDLDSGEADTVQFEYQDWGTLWMALYLTEEQEEKVLTFARCFYFSA